MLLFIVITFVTFVIFFVGPNNPARAVCGGEQAKRACLVLATEKLGLNQPMPVQYWKFLKRLVVHQDLGTSYATSQSVNQRIKQAAPVTASLVFGGAVLWMMIGLSVGIFSALKPRSLLDRAAMIFVLIGVSAHPIWIGLILEYVFGVKLGWTPIANYANFFGAPAGSGQPGGPWQWFYHLILPWITLAVLFIGFYGRVLRSNMLDWMSEDYVRTARAKGLPPRSVLRRHVLRNSLIPIVTLFGLDFAAVLGGGAILTETVYDLHGVGFYAFTAIGNLDLPPLIGVTLYGAFFIVLFSTLVDVAYAYLDPRIRPT